MWYKSVFRVIFCAVIISQFTGGGGEVFAAEKFAAEKKVTGQRFVIGRISTKPTTKLPKLEAMSRYLSQALPDTEQITFDEIIVPSVGAMVKLLKTGAVDLVSETPLAAMELVQAAGAEIILHEWKKGVAEYSTILITRKESGITSLEDLKGRVIAFEDPGSTSGFLLPLALLRSQGFECVELDNVGDKPSHNQIGYIFARHEINVTSFVVRGMVDAGALSNLDWEDQDEVPFGLRQHLQILYESKPVLRSVVLVRAGLKPSLKHDLIQLFQQMHESPEGRTAMKKYNKVLKFTPITDSYDEQMLILREFYRLVRDKIR